MTNYAFIFHGVPQFDGEEAQAEEGAKYGAWLQGLGDAVVNPGIPVGPAKAVNRSGVTENGGLDRITGFMIIQADSLDAAVEIAKTSPYMEHGTIEVAEAYQM